ASSRRRFIPSQKRVGRKTGSSSLRRFEQSARSWTAPVPWRFGMIGGKRQGTAAVQDDGYLRGLRKTTAGEHPIAGRTRCAVNMHTNPNRFGWWQKRYFWLK